MSLAWRSWRKGGLPGATDSTKERYMLTDAKKAQLKRLAMNAIVVAVGGAATALLQFAASLDWGPWSAIIMSGTTLATKSIQIWAEPVIKSGERVE